MLSPGETKPGEDARETSDNLFRAISRLVPNSGIQFLDIAIPRHAIDGVIRHFKQERIRYAGTTTWAISPAKSSFSAGHDEASGGHLTVNGRTALTAALDQWLPLPYLRFVARDGSGQPRFDEGPFNWARLFISSPRPDEDQSIYRGVIAFDTRTDPQSRIDVATYVMPTDDDVQFSSTFSMTDDAEQLASYLAEDWVQTWIEGVFPLLQQPATAENSQIPRASGLHQIAGYLTLLTVLRRAAVLPSLQFYDMRPNVVEPVPVDIVIDIGSCRSAAMLVEASGGRPQIADGRLLSLRDLARPTVRHVGAFDSRIAFSRAQFGSEVLSRKSGRADAFNWPSLARTGPEAVRLSCQSRASDGAIGLTSPKTHLRNLGLRDDTWRFAADPTARVRRSQMISGRLLAQASPTAGLLTGPAGSAKPLVLRPRYALSSMTSFLIAEIVLQALATINAPTTVVDDDRLETVRQIRQIVLCAPLTMPLEERDLLRDRAQSAIDMLWRALDWDSAPEISPPRPVVRLGLDETLSAQLVYLYDEIAHRFSGDPRAFLDLIGKSRPQFGVQPCVRFGALDVGGNHTTMTIVTYASTPEAPIGPKLLGAQRSAIAGNVVLDHLVATLILPALASAIARAGGEDARGFLTRLIEHPDGADATYDPATLGNRFNELWLRPAALTLLQMSAGLVGSSGTARFDARLAALVAGQGGLNMAVAEELAVAIEAIRSEPLDFGAVTVSFHIRDIQQAVRVALEPMVTSLSRALVGSDCDALLLTGWAARLPILKDLLLEHFPWRPDRIIALQDHAWHAWYPMSDADRAAADGKEISLIGALLALAGGERLGFGGGESGFPFGGEGFGGARSDDGWQAAAPPGGAT